MRKILLIISGLVLVACQKTENKYNGYIDADLTYLSSDFGGRIANLAVTRGEFVQNGQLLFKLEQTNESRNIAISQANQDNLQAQHQQVVDKINYTQANYNRLQKLEAQGAASSDELDQAQQNLNVLKNQLSSINAQLVGNKFDTAQKNWQLERKQNIAPESGIVFDSYFNPSEYVQSGTPILSLITSKNIKVIFFVPENELGKIHLGENISFTSDGNSTPQNGAISYISAQAEYTPPIIFSSEDRQKLVFRIEARLDNPSLTKIHLGQPVTLELK